MLIRTPDNLVIIKNMTNNLPKNLKICRKARKMTQEQVANELKIPRIRYNRWETGRTEPSISNILALRRLFSVSMDFLFFNEGEEVTHVSSGKGLSYQHGRGYFYE